MNSQEISQYLNVSAHKYFEYLKRERKSLSKTPIAAVKKHNDYFILHTKNRLKSGYETGRIEIMGKTYPSDSFTLVYTDNNKKRYAIATKDRELVSALGQANEDNAFFVTDMSFLVKKVEMWSGGDNRISPPEMNDNVSLDEVNLKGGSAAQIKAVRGVLTEPMSYVWGAPGTGKTRFVLAKCVLSYIKADKKIVIVAPTNNALDQTLRGVVEVLENEGIDYKKCVWRLGSASYEFSRAYPAICENTYLSNRLKKIKQDIEYAEELSKCEDQLKSSDRILKIMADFEQDYQLLQAVPLAASDLSRFKSKYYDLELEISAAKSRYLAAERDVETANRLISYFTKKWFVIKKRQKIEKLTAEWQEKCDIRDAKLEELHQLETQKYSHDSLLQNVCADLKISRTVFDLDIEKIEIKFAEAQRGYDDISKRISEIRDILDSNLPAEKIIEDCEKQRKELGFDTTEARMGKTLVLGLTIDKLISDFHKITWGGPNGYVHIFLDEAGVCPLSKAIPLFATGVPVAMFGDHMQLPPVCEMSDEDISVEDNREVFLWSQSAMVAPMLFNNDIQELYDLWESGSSELKGLPRFDLTDSYRFGSELARLLAGKVYSTEFRGNSQKSTKIVVIDAGKKRKGGEKRTSISETEAIKLYMQEMSIVDDYVVITPYKNQLKLLKTELKGTCDEENINTVHASQGREWKKVFFSVVDCRNMYFTDSSLPIGLRVINTALSRAQEELIIVCDYDFWSRNSLCENQLLSDIVKNALVWRPANYFDF